MAEHPPFEGTEFQVKVWNALKEILGRGPNLHRNCGSNRASEFCPCGSQCLRPEPIPAIVPCHRVVRRDGGLGGYSGVGGVETKRRLLSEEGVSIPPSQSK